MVFDAFSIPFRDHLGIKVVSAGNGEAHALLPFDASLTNMDGVFHGGALMTVLDIAMAYACGSTQENAKNAVTVDLHVQFLRPGAGDLHAWAVVTRKGRRLVFAEGRITDAHQEVVARAQGVFQLRLPDRD